MNRKSSLPDAILVDTRYEDISMFLGTLETIVMEIAWGNYPLRVTCRSVYRSVTRDGHEQKFSTVAATIHTLVRKRFLMRVVGNGRGSTAHEFMAVCSRDEFIELALRRTLDSFKTYFPDSLDAILNQNNH